MVILCCDSNNGERMKFAVFVYGKNFGFAVVDFSQGFGITVVEWVAFPWVSVYRAWELLVAMKLTEHESFWLQ